MHKFTHVDAFYQVARFVKKINKHSEYQGDKAIVGPVSFRGTVKLHGTNSSVHHTSDGELIFQSRTRVITPTEDNAGFAAFGEKNSKTIKSICEETRIENNISKSDELIVYGEWIGPGVQKGMAINCLPTRQWVIFGFKVVNGEESKYIDYSPSFGDRFKEENIYSIFDAPVWTLQVDFEDQASREAAIEKFEKIVEETERECPWGKKFQIVGIGEGVVWVPTEKFWGNSDLFFKTKGEKHKETSTKDKKEQASPEILNSIQEFVDFSVTENRLNHGIEAMEEAGHEVDIRNIGYYLKWMGSDVMRECAPELEDNKLEWKQVAKAVNERARNFFIARMNELL